MKTDTLQQIDPDMYTMKETFMTVDFTTSVLACDFKMVLCWHSEDTQNRVLESHKVVTLFKKWQRKSICVCICVLHKDINVCMSWTQQTEIA